MKRLVLDTSVLIRFWQARALTHVPFKTVRVEARRLVDVYQTDAIVTPVYIEMVAGTRNGDELRRTRVFLSEFKVIDEWDVSSEDWQEAKRLAERVPRDGRRRQLGDCLVQAIANRLRYEVFAIDTFF